MSKNPRADKFRKILAFSPVFLVLLFAAFLFARASSISRAIAAPLTQEEYNELQATLNRAFPQRTQVLNALPYNMAPPNFDTNAQAAILINAETGEILFEKNADMEIPPASMTKLFLIYSVLQKVRRGEIGLDDIIPVDERAIAANMPPRSSLMFLGLGQIVTLRELLQGTSISSGNDAAYEIAFALYGSMENFIDEINATIKSLGLTKTHIVESSGYSELNMTTPREMATFCKIYLEEFPDTLKEFHSIKEFVYPKEKNLPPEQRGRLPQSFANGFPREFWTPIEQENTNKLLGVLEGCDGIKTGHIDESGYNIALTTKRNGIRYISVTMLGPGNNFKEGDQMRCADGSAMHEWAHAVFTQTELPPQKDFTIPLYGAKEKSARLCLPYEKSYAIPKGDIEFETVLPEYLFGKIERGAHYGKIVAKQNNKPLFEIPLVAQRGIEDANPFIQHCDALVLRCKKAK